MTSSAATTRTARGVMTTCLRLHKVWPQVLFKRPARTGGWRDKDKKFDCLAQGFLSPDLDQYAALPFNLQL